jgi:excisionase family DNA binding protein
MYAPKQDVYEEECSIMEQLVQQVGKQTLSDMVRLNSVKDIVARTGLSRSKVYQEMDSGRLRSVKVGRRRLITESALVDYIDSLAEAGTMRAEVQHA